MAAERRIQIRDARTLHALASPIRYRILGHLMAVGPQTASDCASAVGASPSNCSYHLRELARFGLVERVPVEEIPSGPSRDGRDRPWRPTVTGYGTGPADEAPALGRSATVAARALSHLGIDDSAALAHAAIEAHDDLPPEWRRAEVLSTYGLRASADELRDLVAAIDALVRPFIGLTRTDAPSDARPVHLILDAFRRPSAAPTGAR